MSIFSWYRKLKGGTWYKNRYTYYDNTIEFKWERDIPKSTNEYIVDNVKIETH